MGVASLVLSLIGMFLALIGLIPLLGIVNWFAGFILLIGFILGLIGTIVNKKKGLAIAGLVISFLFLILAVIRLIAGGGIL